MKTSSFGLLDIANCNHFMISWITQTISILLGTYPTNFLTYYFPIVLNFIFYPI